MAERGGFEDWRKFKVERLCGSWLEKEEDRLEHGDALGVWTGGVYGIRSIVGGFRGEWVFSFEVLVFFSFFLSFFSGLSSVVVRRLETRNLNRSEQRYQPPISVGRSEGFSSNFFLSFSRACTYQLRKRWSIIVIRSRNPRALISSR